MAKLSYSSGQYLSARAFIQRFLEVDNPSPELLNLGAQTEQALDNPAGAEEYHQRLRQEFPGESAGDRERRR
jgi:type IV pilus assembly protein PilF